MQTIRQAKELAAKGRKVALAIGTFDGVHLGHQQVIHQALADAEQHEGVTVAVTFDRHPASVVAPSRAPALIYTLDQKLRAMAALGLDATLLLHFDEALSRVPGEEFIRRLVADCGGVKSITVGATFGFGYKRSGNVELLRNLGAELGFNVHGIAAVALDAERVSSTRIRESIRTGALDKANQMLGRAYALSGRVVHGDHLGAKIGFPTANLDIAGLVIPPNGVYAAHAYVLGAAYRGVVNIGVRPTITSSTPQLRFEVHLLDFDGGIYGEEIEVSFVRKLRDEQRFPSLDALKEQITRDIATAQKLF